MNSNRKFLAIAVAAAFAAGTFLPAAAQTGAAPAKPAAAKPAPGTVQRSFASPEEAAKALVEAVRAGSVTGLLEVIGPKSKSWVFTGDKVSDAAEWKTFLASYDRKSAIVKDGEARATLVVGDDWPFPAPLVKKGVQWAFDADAGREEVINRRIGRNELDTIQALLAIVDAQREYAAADADKNGFYDYARRFRSSEGKKDGLYWPVKAGEPTSPLGALVSVAAKEGYGKVVRSEKPEPYNGYHYRILTAQGKDAAGGAYDYLVKDKLLGGFAVVAYPSKYGVSGVMTFVVNHEGVVHEKDLGAATPSVAASMKLYNPDKSWRKSQ